MPVATSTTAHGVDFNAVLFDRGRHLPGRSTSIRASHGNPVLIGCALIVGVARGRSPSLVVRAGYAGVYAGAERCDQRTAYD